MKISSRPSLPRLPVTVVGAVNIDIGGRSYAKPVMCDSNPGCVTQSLGGVGRNIAHNLALLGVPTRLVTVFGDDANADMLLQACKKTGIDASVSARLPGERTSTYLFCNDENGDMLLAVNDMAIYERLTPAYLAARMDVINESCAVVVDANIPEDAIRYLADHCTAPLFADPVSTVKGGRLQPCLGALHTLKPNRMEAELLSGVAIHDEASLRAAADALLLTGMQRVFISLGADGVYAAEAGCHRHFPNFTGKPVSTTGCGDAFMAAIVYAYTGGLNLAESAVCGLAAASITMETASTNNESLSADTLFARLNTYKTEGEHTC